MAQRSSLRPDIARLQRELDDLPPGSVILDQHGRAWQSGQIYWYEACGDSSQVSSWELSQWAGKSTVIHPRAAS